MNIKITQLTESACESKIRDHHLTCDRPIEKGGGNDGPMGGEYFLMGLGGCFTSNLLAAIKSRSADVSNVELTIKATLAESPAIRPHPKGRSASMDRITIGNFITHPRGWK
jgi:putative redox protein